MTRAKREGVGGVTGGACFRKLGRLKTGLSSVGTGEMVLWVKTLYLSLSLRPAGPRKLSSGSHACAEVCLGVTHLSPINK